MTIATPQDIAEQLMKSSGGEPPEDFKKSCREDPAFLNAFIHVIRNELRNEGFKIRFVIFTAKTFFVDDVDRWAQEIANIMLGNSPSADFMSSIPSE